MMAGGVSQVKRVLLILDSTQAGASAMALALRLGRVHGAKVTGMAVVDPDLVTTPEAVPIGGDAYKQHKDRVLIQQACANGAALGEAFRAEAKAAGVEATASVASDEALNLLIAASALNDIVVTAFDATCGAAESGRVSPVIERLLRDNPRPLIVTPPALNAGTRTLVAYDGSVPAMRALQLFCYAGIARDDACVVLSVQGEAREAERVGAEAAAFLNERGRATSVQALVSSEAPSRAIIEAARAAGAGLIVAGAYGHRGWREWLLGTTTKELLAALPCPLFVHH